MGIIDFNKNLKKMKFITLTTLIAVAYAKDPKPDDVITCSSTDKDDKQNKNRVEKCSSIETCQDAAGVLKNEMCPEFESCGEWEVANPDDGKKTTWSGCILT